MNDTASNADEKQNESHTRMNRNWLSRSSFIVFYRYFVIWANIDITEDWIEIGKHDLLKSVFMCNLYKQWFFLDYQYVHQHRKVYRVAKTVQMFWQFYSLCGIKRIACSIKSHLDKWIYWFLINLIDWDMIIKSLRFTIIKNSTERLIFGQW